jgi:hypothetical protein
VADISIALFVLGNGASLAPPAGTASAAPLPRRPLWQRIAAVTAGALVMVAIASALTWCRARTGAAPRLTATRPICLMNSRRAPFFMLLT